MFKKNVSDIEDVEAFCTCRRFEQYGLLCRHIFLVFRLFKVNNIPKKFINKRWTKDVVPNEINHSFDTAEFGDSKFSNARKIAREIVLAGEYLANNLITDFKELSLVNEQMKLMMAKVDEGRFNRPSVVNKYDRYSSILRYNQPSDTVVRLPSGIKNKGRGKQKRIKSQKERAISRSGKRKRACGFCKTTGHNRRKCPKMLSQKCLQDEDEVVIMEDQTGPDEEHENQVQISEEGSSSDDDEEEDEIEDDEQFNVDS